MNKIGLLNGGAYPATPDHVSSLYWEYSYMESVPQKIASLNYFLHACISNNGEVPTDNEWVFPTNIEEERALTALRIALHMFEKYNVQKPNRALKTKGGKIISAKRTNPVSIFDSLGRLSDDTRENLFLASESFKFATVISDDQSHIAHCCNVLKTWMDSRRIVIGDDRWRYTSWKKSDDVLQLLRYDLVRNVCAIAFFDDVVNESTNLSTIDSSNLVEKMTECSIVGVVESDYVPDSMFLNYDRHDTQCDPGEPLHSLFVRHGRLKVKQIKTWLPEFNKTLARLSEEKGMSTADCVEWRLLCTSVKYFRTSFWFVEDSRGIVQPICLVLTHLKDPGHECVDENGDYWWPTFSGIILEVLLMTAESLCSMREDKDRVRFLIAGDVNVCNPIGPVSDNIVIFNEIDEAGPTTVPTSDKCRTGGNQGEKLGLTVLADDDWTRPFAVKNFGRGVLHRDAKDIFAMKNVDDVVDASVFLKHVPTPNLSLVDPYLFDHRFCMLTLSNDVEDNFTEDDDLIIEEPFIMSCTRAIIGLFVFLAISAIFLVG